MAVRTSRSQSRTSSDDHWWHDGLPIGVGAVADAALTSHPDDRAWYEHMHKQMLWRCRLCNKIVDEFRQHLRPKKHTKWLSAAASEHGKLATQRNRWCRSLHCLPLWFWMKAHGIKFLMLSIRNCNTSASASAILIVLVLARAIATFWCHSEFRYGSTQC